MPNIGSVVMNYEKELLIAIIQQAVDDFIWCCKFKSGCIDCRYEEFYFDNGNKRKKVRKKKEIFISKVNMMNDLKEFFESDWGELICQYSIGRNSNLIYNALVKNYGIDDSIQRGLDEGVLQ